MSAPSVLSVAEIRDLMSANVGLFRDADGLGQATRRLDAGWQTLIARVDDEPASLTADDWRTASLLTVGRLVARAACAGKKAAAGTTGSIIPSETICTGSGA